MICRITEAQVDKVVMEGSGLEQHMWPTKGYALKRLKSVKELMRGFWLMFRLLLLPDRHLIATDVGVPTASYALNVEELVHLMSYMRGDTRAPIT
jgi:hypothetical protein